MILRLILAGAVRRVENQIQAARRATTFKNNALVRARSDSNSNNGCAPYCHLNSSCECVSYQN